MTMTYDSEIKRKALSIEDKLMFLKKYDDGRAEEKTKDNRWWIRDTFFHFKDCVENYIWRKTKRIGRGTIL